MWSERRLRAERPWREHLPLYRDLLADPAVAAALWPGEGEREAAARRAAEMLDADIRHWQARAFGPWVFFERVTGMFVGRGGLQGVELMGEQCVEVLYALRADAWGRGYASEIAALAVAHARRLGIAEVVGMTADTNRASRRVLEGAGLRFERTFTRAGLPHWLGRLRPIV